MDFSVVIFDTAPTGHTLRFLSMPNLFVKGMEKLGKLKGQFGSIVSQVCITYKPQTLLCKHCDFYFNVLDIIFKPWCLLTQALPYVPVQRIYIYIPSNRTYTMYCGFILLQLLPMVGVTLGEDPTSLVGRLQHSAPSVKQINTEFQDPVSQPLAVEYGDVLCILINLNIWQILCLKFEPILHIQM